MTTYNVTQYTTGDTLEIEVTCRYANQAPVSLTGATALWKVAPVTPRAIGSPIYTASIGDGIEVLDAANGILLITMLAGGITAPGDYQHHLRLTLPGGETFTPLQGAIKANRAVITA